MTCESCRAKDREIAQLKRDLQEAADAVDVMKDKWLAVKEGKGEKNG